MSMPLCRLCALHPTVETSHVTSAFVFRAIKSDSPTGFFRNPNNPNQRIQDGDKCSLLCTFCEQRFSNAEKQFAEKIFTAFHVSDQDTFIYGPWLHYFMTSLAWRTLVLDLPGLQSDSANPPAALSDLVTASEIMRKYLLGASNLGESIRNHAVAWTIADSASAELSWARPNVAIRRSVFGYTVVERLHGYSGVLHNLAGFMCFLIVKGNPRDTWHATKVSPSGGELKPPQSVKSWLMNELLGRITDCAHMSDAMSDVQRQKVGDAMRENPSAAAMRFGDLDNRLAVSH